MMFRDQAQRGEVCRVLCEAVDLRGFWTEAGPSARAKKALDTALADDYHYPEDPVSLIWEQYPMFFLAWAVWANWRLLPFADLLTEFDGENLRLIGELLVALSAGSAGVDGWLVRHGAR